jgi:hypothetical protein
MFQSYPVCTRLWYLRKRDVQSVGAQIVLYCDALTAACEACTCRSSCTSHLQCQPHHPRKALLQPEHRVTRSYHALRPKGKQSTATHHITAQRTSSSEPTPFSSLCDSMKLAAALWAASPPPPAAAPSTSRAWSPCGASEWCAAAAEDRCCLLIRTWE